MGRPARKLPPYSDRVFERFFKRELDIENPTALAAVMKEAGLDADAFERYVAHDGPRELSEAFAAGDRDGVFGVPTLIVDGEPFWGTIASNGSSRSSTQWA